MTNWRKFLNDIIGGFSGDGGAAQDDSIKASLDLAHTEVGTVDTVVDGIQSYLNNRTSSTDPLMCTPFDVIENIFDIDMGYWTEVDVPGRVTIDYTNERIAIADLDRDEDVYVYKATDANVTDFILDFEFQVLNTSVNGSTFGIGLADGLGTMEDVSNGLYAYIYFGGANNTSVYLAHLTNGTKAMSGSIASLLDDTTYYGRLIRRGSYCWLGIYSDKIRETHVTGSPVEYRDVTPNSFTHLYPMSGEDDGGAALAMDAYVEAIRLISNSTISNIETATAKPEIIANIFDIDMGYWTEVDVPGRVTIDYANERIEIVDLDSDEDVYVYKVTDANVNDFILDFEYQLLSTSGDVSSCGIGLADSVGTMEDVNNGLFLRIYHIGVGNNSVGIVHITGGTISASIYITGLSDDTIYYGRLIRRGSYCWLGIYSDHIRETHVATSPKEYKDVTPVAFTHLYPMSAYDNGDAGRALDAYVERIKLVSAPDIDKYLGRHVE